ncbi:DUF4304 domain-containing protein [Cellulomonas cellasea]|uniref:DUF4304 domain-containing protein n=2 Tax=Cellulomonas cellasea TaxID=43670 RepID=A0A0A0BBM1_9CELL|nr:DUF4304 domain-containing protein [Cellulomonas cellasea]KGM03533.1 hypothetical protein Q760_02520 [Cellulomonas cellasea DSM 20118]
MDPDAADAPVLLAEMLRTSVAPALRELGLRGSGQSYRLTNAGGDHALLGIQKSVASSRSAALLTVNLAYFPGADWDAAHAAGQVAARPTASARWIPSGWQTRIGLLVDEPHDHWLTVRSPADVSVVSAHLLALVRDLALPQLTARLTGATPPPVPVAPAGDRPRVCPWPELCGLRWPPDA